MAPAHAGDQRVVDARTGRLLQPEQHPDPPARSPPPCCSPSGAPGSTHRSIRVPGPRGPSGHRRPEAAGETPPPAAGRTEAAGRSRSGAGVVGAPPPSYLPRSRQTRGACGSGSRPYSGAAAAPRRCYMPGRRPRAPGRAPSPAAAAHRAGAAERSAGRAAPAGPRRRSLRPPRRPSAPGLRSLVPRAWRPLGNPRASRAAGPRAALLAGCSGRGTGGGAGGGGGEGAEGGNRREPRGGGAAEQRSPGGRRGWGVAAGPRSAGGVTPPRRAAPG